MQRLKRSLIKLTAICSVISGCAGIPKPEGKIGVLHSKGVAEAKPYVNWFDMQDDFDDEGEILPDAKGEKVALLSLKDVDKHAVMSASSYANLRAAWKKLKERYKDCKR